MKVFISYASEDRDMAEQISLALLENGFTTFFDQENLPPAQAYHTRIRLAVEASDALVFLISPESVASGSYALTELGYARRKWPHPTGAVLPVMARQVKWESVPNYLKSVTVLKTSGNVAAEVLAAVSEFQEQHGADGDKSRDKKNSFRWHRPWVVGALTILIVAVAAALLATYRPGIFQRSPQQQSPPIGQLVNDPTQDPATSTGTSSLRRLEFRLGEPITVRVDVGQVISPYRVVLGGKTLIQSLVSREENVSDLPIGDHMLSWVFSHAARGWYHRVSVAAPGRPEIVVEQRREGAGTQDASLNSVVLAIVPPSSIRRLQVARGQRVTLAANVSPMSSPYTISVGGKVLINSTASQEAIVPDLPPGEHVISWAFNHFEKEWWHKLTMTIGDGVPVTLEERRDYAGRGIGMGSAILEVRR